MYRYHAFNILFDFFYMFQVVFFPTTVEHCSQPFAIICDNCQVKYISLEGQCLKQDNQEISSTVVSFYFLRWINVFGFYR